MFLCACACVNVKTAVETVPWPMTATAYHFATQHAPRFYLKTNAKLYSFFSSLPSSPRFRFPIIWHWRVNEFHIKRHSSYLCTIIIIMRKTLWDMCSSRHVDWCDKRTHCENLKDTYHVPMTFGEKMFTVKNDYFISSRLKVITF